MKAKDVTDTLQLALQASGCDQDSMTNRPRLLSDNGASYIAGELAEWLKGKGMSHVRGAPRIFEEITDRLELDGEGTTEDNKYTVETVACVGCCALAPVMTINEEVYGDLTKQKVRKLVPAKGDQNGEE